MEADEVRFLFPYDRWATRRVLTVLDGAVGRARSGLPWFDAGVVALSLAIGRFDHDWRTGIKGRSTHAQ